MRTYPAIRALHLYAGLFVSPFLVLFAASVFFLVHAWIPGVKSAPASRTVSGLTLPDGLETAQGREQVAALRPVLAALDVRGEIGFVRYAPKQRRFTFPVLQPGREVMVELDAAARTAVVSTRVTGLVDAMVYLHKMPGPHNVSIRGNSGHVQLWRWLADGTVYLLLLVTCSGLYLWAVLRAERKIGLVLLAAGACSLGVLIHALVA